MRSIHYKSQFFLNISFYFPEHCHGEWEGEVHPEQIARLSNLQPGQLSGLVIQCPLWEIIVSGLALSWYFNCTSNKIPVFQLIPVSIRWWMIYTSERDTTQCCYGCTNSLFRVDFKTYFVENPWTATLTWWRSLSAWMIPGALFSRAWCHWEGLPKQTSPGWWDRRRAVQKLIYETRQGAAPRGDMGPSVSSNGLGWLSLLYHSSADMHSSLNTFFWIWSESESYHWATQRISCIGLSPIMIGEWECPCATALMQACVPRTRILKTPVPSTHGASMS